MAGKSNPFSRAIATKKAEEEPTTPVEAVPAISAIRDDELAQVSNDGNAPEANTPDAGSGEETFGLGDTLRPGKEVGASVQDDAAAAAESPPESKQDRFGLDVTAAAGGAASGGGADTGTNIGGGGGGDTQTSIGNGGGVPSEITGGVKDDLEAASGDHGPAIDLTASDPLVAVVGVQSGGERLTDAQMALGTATIDAISATESEPSVAITPGDVRLATDVGAVVGATSAGLGAGFAAGSAIGGEVTTAIAFGFAGAGAATAAGVVAAGAAGVIIGLGVAAATDEQTTRIIDAGVTAGEETKEETEAKAEQGRKEAEARKKAREEEEQKRKEEEEAKKKREAEEAEKKAEADEAEKKAEADEAEKKPDAGTTTDPDDQPLTPAQRAALAAIKAELQPQGNVPGDIDPADGDGTNTGPASEGNLSVADQIRLSGITGLVGNPGSPDGAGAVPAGNFGDRPPIGPDGREIQLEDGDNFNIARGEDEPDFNVGQDPLIGFTSQDEDDEESESGKQDRVGSLFGFNEPDKDADDDE